MKGKVTNSKCLRDRGSSETCGRTAAYCRVFWRSGCRFLSPAEDCETHWTGQLWASAQRVSLTERWRKNSGQGAAAPSATEEPWVEAWRRTVVGGKDSPQGTSPLEEDCSRQS